jgi:hypothetical protein
VAGGSVTALLAVLSVFRSARNGKSLDAMAGRFPTVTRNAPAGVIMHASTLWWVKRQTSRLFLLA